MSHYLVRQVEAAANVDVRLGSEVVGGGADGTWLDHLVLRRRGRQGGDGAGPGAFLMIGAHPRTDWLPPEIARLARLHPDWSDLRDCGWPLERAPAPA